MPIRRIFRPVARLAAVVVPLIAGIAAAPAAFARFQPPSGPDESITPAAPVIVRTVTVGGTPGWQIALFIVVAALLAAITAIILDRLRTARRQRPAAHPH